MPTSCSAAKTCPAARTILLPSIICTPFAAISIDGTILFVAAVPCARSVTLRAVVVLLFANQISVICVLRLAGVVYTAATVADNAVCAKSIGVIYIAPILIRVCKVFNWAVILCAVVKLA